MPPGHSAVSTVMLPAESRVPCHQPSSMLTYWYPASLRPDATSASTCSLMTLYVIFAANVFHDAQPIGGVVTTLFGAACDTAGPNIVTPAARTANSAAWPARHTGA